MKQVVKFRSINENFKKEKSGIKNNTIRFYGADERFNILDKFRTGEIKNLNIEIQESRTGETFRRSIRDVTVYAEIYIITWEAK